MILPDANLLLYSVNKDSPDHEAAFSWWKKTLESRVPVRIAYGVAFAFLRLSTNRRVFTQPLTVSEAFAYLNNWLTFPSVALVNPQPEDFPVIAKWLEAAGTGGNLVSDAQTAAIAHRLKGRVYSADSDFARFRGIDWHNPLG